MNRVGILCEKDSTMMHEFSRRSLDRLDGMMLSAALSLFSSYLEANVHKEVEKDRFIIEETAAAFAAGRPACDLDLEGLFENTKKYDKAFLENLMIPSFTISVHYSDFADVRIRRIWRIAKTVYALLGAWREGASFADTAQAAYTAEEFKGIVADILRLYSLETRMLGDAIRSPFHAGIHAVTETLFRAMEKAASELSSDCTELIYGAAGRAECGPGGRSR